MTGFLPISNAYRASSTQRGRVPVQLVEITDIGPVRRQPLFRDDHEEGVPVSERVCRLLRGFRLGQFIPPVEIVDSPGTEHRYKLTHGAHRLYCSLLVGFSHIPTVPGFDMSTF